MSVISSLCLSKPQTPYMSSDLPYRDQVSLLLQLLPIVGREEDFALKGGTAITRNTPVPVRSRSHNGISGLLVDNSPWKCSRRAGHVDGNWRRCLISREPGRQRDASRMGIPRKFLDGLEVRIPKPVFPERHLAEIAVSLRLAARPVVFAPAVPGE
jgi:hypothetical protein